MARWCERVALALSYVLACWLLLVVGTVAAVLLGIYVAFIVAVLFLFSFVHWLLKKLA